MSELLGVGPKSKKCCRGSPALTAAHGPDWASSTTCRWTTSRHRHLLGEAISGCARGEVIRDAGLRRRVRRHPAVRSRGAVQGAGAVSLFDEDCSPRRSSRSDAKAEPVVRRRSCRLRGGELFESCHWPADQSPRIRTVPLLAGLTRPAHRRGRAVRPTADHRRTRHRARPAPDHARPTSSPNAACRPPVPGPHLHPPRRPPNWRNAGSLSGHKRKTHRATFHSLAPRSCASSTPGVASPALRHRRRDVVQELPTSTARCTKKELRARDLVDFDDLVEMPGSCRRRHLADRALRAAGRG